ncbi:MAG: DUF2948 family protein [Pseudomonadota bacterium]
MPTPPRDASFKDGFEPIRLRAIDIADLQVVSALMQDAVFTARDVSWMPGRRRFALVANRFRWEAPALGERVRVGLHFEHVTGARVRGIDPGAADQVVSLLSVMYEPAKPGAPVRDGEELPTAGNIRLTGSGNVEILLTVEALDAQAHDMTTPWSAKGIPAHEIGGEALE